MRRVRASQTWSMYALAAQRFVRLIAMIPIIVCHVAQLYVVMLTGYLLVHLSSSSTCFST